MNADTEITGKAIGIAVIIGIAIITLFMSIDTVEAGNKGIMKTWGAVTGETLEPGLYFKIPLAQTIIKVDVRTQLHKEESHAASKDLQAIATQTGLNYHIRVDKVRELYQEIGLDISSKIISPAIDESVKASTAKFTADEMITRREELKIKITENLEHKLNEFYIVVDEFSITDLAFSPEYDHAIEQKQIAEQNAQRALRELEQTKIEAEKRIVDEQALANQTIIAAEANKKSVVLTAEASALNKKIDADASANATRIRADADAYAIKIKADAEAERIRKVADELTSDYLKKNYYDSWNGALPQYIFGEAMNLLMQLPD